MDSKFIIKRLGFPSKINFFIYFDKEKFNKENKLFFKLTRNTNDELISLYKEKHISFYKLFFGWLLNENILYEWISCRLKMNDSEFNMSSFPSINRDEIFANDTTLKLGCIKGHRIDNLIIGSFYFGKCDNILKDKKNKAWSTYSSEWMQFVNNNDLMNCN